MSDQTTIRMGPRSPSDLASGEGGPLRFRERVRLKVGGAELLIFLVGKELFAVELKSVDEAVESLDVRAVPESPRGMLGVFTLREGLLSLYSTSHVLGPSASGGIALVMRSGARRIGLAIDDVEDVIHVTLAELRDPPPGVNDDDVVAGLIWRDGRLVTVLDARALVVACASVTLPTSV